MSRLAPDEQSVVDAIAERQDEIVELAATLVAFDTTAREVGEPARDERALQEHLAARLAAVGAEIDLFEPDAEAMAGRPLVPPGLDFVGRPQLLARLRGKTPGPALVFNGHIDAVPARESDGWTASPLVPTVRDGKLYGRGACDMKGGIAAMTVAAEVLASLGAVAGELVVATNTDEESSGAGGTALVDRGLRADAVIVTEPTGLEVWTCCRGSSYATIVIDGRSGHAEVAHPDWRAGGAVNPIEKTAVVLAAIQELRERWAADVRFSHRVLSPPDVVPTIVKAGDWAVTIPASAELTVAALFLPVQAGDDGLGKAVEKEIEAWITGRCAEQDDWLAAHPPRFRWWPNSVMPYAVSDDEPVVQATLGAVAALGRPARASGLDSWFDAATFATLAGIPSIGLGPGGIDSNGVSTAHAVDEHVPVADLVATAQALALAALRFSGVAAEP